MASKGQQLLAVLCAALLVLGAAGCGSKEAAPEKAPLVKTQQAGGNAGAVEGVYAGTVKGRYETNMAFQVGGQIISRNVQAGSLVHAGDTLMVIDARDVVQQANQGEAAVGQARAQLELAQKNLARYTELYNESAVAASVLDQYQTNYDAAFARYQNALAQAAKGHNAVGYTNLTAGADGVITAVQAEEGQVVAAGQTVLTLVQTGELEVEINVPENRVAELQEGTPVRVSFWALHTDAEGTVREIAPMADPAARTYRVRVSIPQPPAGMELGMTASVALAQSDTDDAAASVLPLAAIYQTGDTPQVWVVTDDDTVTLKDVTVEEFNGDQVIVHGLQPTDLVVTAGVHKLRDGQQVRTEADD